MNFSETAWTASIKQRVKSVRKIFFCFLAALLIISGGNASGTARKIKFNFNDVEIVNIIKFIGKATGTSFIFNSAKLKGKKVTFLSNQKFTSREAHKILESILNLHRLSVINEGNVSRIVASNEAKGSSTPMDSKRVHPGSYVTRIIPIKYANPRTVLSSLNRLVSKGAILVSNAEAKVLIIRDVKESTEKFAEIVRIIDQKPKDTELVSLEMIELKHANCAEVAGLVDKVFSAMLGPSKKRKSNSLKIKAFADKRTNSLIMIAGKDFLPRIKALIEQLDKEVETHEGNIRVYPLKNAKAKKVAEVLQKVAQTIQKPINKNNTRKSGANRKITIISDDPSNSLVIYAEPEDFSTLENVIEKLDKRRAQVFIQALIVEVKFTKSMDLGIKWQSGAVKKYDNDKKSLIGVGNVDGFPKTTQNINVPAGSIFGILGDTISFGGTDYFSFNAFVQALQQDSEIDILANPQILTLDNEEAQIKVGQTVPTSSGVRYDNFGNQTYNLDYKDVGIELKITPQINFNDSIELKIYQNTSNVLSEDTIGQQSAITTLNRTLQTSVIVENGHTVVLGGLIEDQVQSRETKTPCLGDIPVLGWFFKSHHNDADKTNLMVFLTPKVIRNKKELLDLTDKAKTKINRTRQGNFRVDVSRETGILTNVDKDDDLEEKPDDSEKSKEIPPEP